MESYSGEEFVNVGVGSDVAVRDLAEAIKAVVGYNGEISQDLSKPDGTPRKLMDVSRLASLGWKPSITLEAGIRSTYQWFLENVDQVRD